MRKKTRLSLQNSGKIAKIHILIQIQLMDQKLSLVPVWCQNSCDITNSYPKKLPYGCAKRRDRVVARFKADTSSYFRTVEIDTMDIFCTALFQSIRVFFLYQFHNTLWRRLVIKQRRRARKKQRLLLPHSAHPKNSCCSSPTATC